MTILSAAKTILEADATLLATATGGVYDFNETGALGVNRTLTTDAFDSNGLVKPSVLLRLRSSTPDGFINDDANQSRSSRDMLECWFYENAGYININTMRDRVYTLLHGVQLTGSFICYWDGDIRGQRDVDLDANVERTDYLVRRLRT